jgi:hypothetical protein
MASLQVAGVFGPGSACEGASSAADNTPVRIANINPGSNKAGPGWRKRLSSVLDPTTAINLAIWEDD